MKNSGSTRGNGAECDPRVLSVVASITLLCRAKPSCHRRIAPGSILAGVGAIAAPSVDQKRFVSLRVHSPHYTLRVQAVSSLWHKRHSAGVVAPATLAGTAARTSGNFFPRFAPRRSIPEQAISRKKYRCGTPPVSKMSNNEDSTASLGHSDELSVQHSPGATIPDFRPEFDDRTPGTFSQTIHRGRSLPASRQYSMASLP